MYRLVLIFFIFLNLNAKDFTCNEESKAYLQKNMQEQFDFYKNCLSKELNLDKPCHKVSFCKSDEEHLKKKVENKSIFTNFKISKNTKIISTSSIANFKRVKESMKIYVFKNTNKPFMLLDFLMKIVAIKRYKENFILFKR